MLEEVIVMSVSNQHLPWEDWLPKYAWFCFSFSTENSKSVDLPSPPPPRVPGKLGHLVTLISLLALLSESKHVVPIVSIMSARFIF